jgi:Ser-tRNA(Ala) deacylase AlaX
VASVDGAYILLEETIAFSFSGGQESDEGMINNCPIFSSEIVGHNIFYTLDSHHGLCEGDEVYMEINWPRRYKLMRLHFAAELVLELVMRALEIEKIGAHIFETKARINGVRLD